MSVWGMSVWVWVREEVRFYRFCESLGSKIFSYGSGKRYAWISKDIHGCMHIISIENFMGYTDRSKDLYGSPTVLHTLHNTHTHITHTGTTNIHTLTLTRTHTRPHDHSHTRLHRHVYTTHIHIHKRPHTHTHVQTCTHVQLLTFGSRKLSSDSVLNKRQRRLMR